MGFALLRPKLAAAAVLMASIHAVGQTSAGSAFTYQGKLTDQGSAATGVYDFEFRLYDGNGTQVAGPFAIEDKQVTNGLFTATLDFGQNGFNGEARFLEIAVRDGTSTDPFVPLAPRQELTPTPYAIMAEKLALPYAETFSTAQQTAFKVTHSGSLGYALMGEATGDRTPGVYGLAAGEDCKGVRGEAINSAVVAVEGYAGVAGNVTNYGGLFTAKGNTARAVYGSASASTGANYGVYGRSLSTTGCGVYGLGYTSTGVNYGLYGQSNSPDGYAGYFLGRGYFSGGLGIGVTVPTAAVDVAGTVKMTGFQLTTAPSSGYVLTSDAGGTGAWQPVPSGPWQKSGSDIYYSAGKVGVGVSSPAAGLDVAGGNNWDVANTEGDFRLGSSTYRLKMGVALSGGGAGNARIYSQGGANRLTLGAGIVDVLSVVDANGGSVGLGTLNPAAGTKLDVAGTLKMTGFQLGTSATAGHVLTANASGVGMWQPASVSLPYTGSGSDSIAAFRVTNTHVTSGAGIYGSGTSYGLRGDSGSTGVHGFSSAGNGVYGSTNTGVGVQARSVSGGTALYAKGNGTTTNNPAAYIENNNSGGIAVFSTCSSTDANAVIVNKGAGDLIKGFSGSTGGNLVFRVQNDGTTSVSVLTITGGADLAEKFDTSEKAEPGMVMEIDPDNTGKLRVSRGAYNRRVAGVVSGANGVDAGMVLSNLPGEKDTRPVALSGRVWVYCDAGEKAIRPGDMLTTADRPGHAMAVADFERAHGAVLGKAMSKLDKGQTGMVLALINLQ